MKNREQRIGVPYASRVKQPVPLYPYKFVFTPRRVFFYRRILVSDVSGLVPLSTYRMAKIPGRRAVAFLLNLISALVQFVRQIDLAYWKTPW